MTNFNENQIENYSNDNETFFAKKMTELFNGYGDLESFKNSLIATANEALVGVSLNSSYDAKIKEVKINNIVNVLDFASKLNIENDVSYLDDLKTEAEKKNREPQLTKLVWFSDENAVDPSETKEPFTLEKYLELNHKG